MAYLGTKELEAILPNCIDKFDRDRIDNVAYELSLGDEVYLTDSKDGKREKLDNINSQVVIKPGQFALLLTDEVVSIPNDLLAFISIKFSQKIKGLINVSGFHVDPGFKGKIIFSVYNAGPATIVLDKGKPYFMIWLSKLTSASDPYDGKHNGQNSISAENVSALTGELASPSSLLTQIKELSAEFDQKIDKLKGKQGFNRWVFQAIAVILFGLLVKAWINNDQLEKGYEYGINNKAATEQVKALNLDSIVSRKVDSIVKIEAKNDGTKE